MTGPPDFDVTGSLQARSATLPSFREATILLAFVALDVFLFSDAIVPTVSNLHSHNTPTAVIIIYSLVGWALLVVRRRAPLMCLAVICLCSSVAAVTIDYRPIIPVCIAVTTAVARQSLVNAIASVALAILTTTTWVYAENATQKVGLNLPQLLGILIIYATLILVASGIGWWVQMAARAAERRRVESAEFAVRTERLRMARELHDIVAHAVTLMTLQAAGARTVLTTDPGRALAALDVIDRTGSQAMKELRRLLGVLRSASPDEVTDESGALSLPPGLADLPPLIDSIRSTGIAITLKSVGIERPLDQSVNSAAYRIISEALTNVTKHSGTGTTAEVTITWGSYQLIIDVLDDGAGQRSRKSLSTGNGLLGLTERVVLVGGAFQTHPRSTGGYEVHAELPIRDSGQTEWPLIHIGTD